MRVTEQRYPFARDVTMFRGLVRRLRENVDSELDVAVGESDMVIIPDEAVVRFFICVLLVGQYQCWSGGA